MAFDFVVEYPKIAVVLAVVMLVLGSWVVVLLRREPPGPGTRGQVMMLLASVFLASMVVGILSAVRITGWLDFLGTETQDRVFRISLFSLRIFIVGALLYIIRWLRQEDDE